MVDLAHVLLFSQSLAREAGALMVKELQKQQSDNGRQSGVGSHYKGGTELVTEADLRVDELVCDAIRRSFPTHLILAEESAPDSADANSLLEPLWIIDPIDGTVNYAHDHAHSAVSIAYAEGGKIRCGVVFNPFADEMFYASEGSGAFLNGVPIGVAGKTEIRRALFATGFPYEKGDMTPLVRRMAVMLSHCADLRRRGSAALDICWVAMGRLDIYYENLSLWDFAAAQLIATEAGARYGHFQPVPQGINPVFHNKNILVSNDVLFEQALVLLQQADRSRGE